MAKAKILANNELFFKSGSDINLTCVSLQATHPPSYIYWYKDGYLINYSQRGGINVLTERQTRTSTLVISRAVPPDSGNYTCFPSNTSKFSAAPFCCVCVSCTFVLCWYACMCKDYIDIERCAFEMV